MTAIIMKVRCKEETMTPDRIGSVIELSGGMCTVIWDDAPMELGSYPVSLLWIIPSEAK